MQWKQHKKSESTSELQVFEQYHLGYLTSTTKNLTIIRFQLRRKENSNTSGKMQRKEPEMQESKLPPHTYVLFAEMLNC